ncbi:MAG TPA: hypothetical protein VEH04_14725 [Verrucomicrobiae bacterium]|nr:hypothetical protein [Verrucomicrobiae bacterium]
MNSLLHPISKWTVALVITVACLHTAHAFPPAPHHVIHGSVRDEFGDPLSLGSAQVFLETTNNVFIACQVSPEIAPGENYRLIVPMDSLSTPDVYKTAALRPTVPFRLKVQIGNTVYLPLEMAGNFATLGQPAGETLINLTLGVDSDGDGLPDAWEQLLIQMLGGGLTLGQITGNGDNDGDGISNLAEYIAGTYAFDPQDGLKLRMVRRNTQGPVIQFFGIAGRTYSILGTTNMSHWADVSMRVPAGNTNAVPKVEHYAPASGIVEPEIVLPPGQAGPMYFRLRVH